MDLIYALVAIIIVVILVVVLIKVLNMLFIGPLIDPGYIHQELQYYINIQPLRV